MQFSIMTIQDYDEVHDLWKKTPQMGLNNLDDSRDGINRYLERNPYTCFIARENGRLAGVILSGHDGRRGFIYHMAVPVSGRGKGTGKKLIEHAIAALKKEGINKIALVVYRDNEEGNAFWEKISFMERKDLYYRDRVVSDVEMERITGQHPPYNFEGQR